MATHSFFYKLCNRPIASSQLQVRQLCHLERFRQTTGHSYATAALRGMDFQITSWLKIEKYDRKNTRRIDMFIHGVLLRSASRRRRRKMRGVDAGMQGVDDRMQAAWRLDASVVWQRLKGTSPPIKRTSPPQIVRPMNARQLYRWQFSQKKKLCSRLSCF